MHDPKNEFALVEIAETNNSATVMKVSSVSREYLEDIPGASRTMVAAWNRIWAIAARLNMNGDEDVIARQITGSSGLEGALTMIDRTYMEMQRLWPHETWFVDQYIYDKTSVLMGMVSTSMLGAFHQMPDLFPADDAVGIVRRLRGGITYFPKTLRQKKADSLNDMIKAVLGVPDTPDSDVDFAIKFPDPND